MIQLSRLPEGVSARVQALRAGSGLRRRLLDIGLTRDAQVCCLFASPSGDPRAYLVRGAVVALRGEDAGDVFVL